MDAAVRQFAVKNDRLYYVKDDDQLLYVSRLDGTEERRLSGKPVAQWFDAIGDNVFFTSIQPDGQMYVYKAGGSEEDVRLLPTAIETVGAMNDTLVCKLADGAGIQIVRPDGEVSLTVADKVNWLLAVYGSADTSTIKWLDLRTQE